MEKKEICNIIKDLLPSYIEKLTNEETNKFIESHISECEECQELLENMRKEIEINAPKKEEKQFKYIKSYSKRLKLFRNILIIIALVFILIIARRFIIITNLSSKANVLKNSSNYYMKLEYYQSNKIAIYEKYNKDDKSLSTENVYYISDSVNVVKSIDYKSANDELHLTNKSEATLLPKTRLSLNIVNYLHFRTPVDMLSTLLTTSIQNVNLDGKQCYLIKINNTERFISAETGLIVKFIDNNLNEVIDSYYEFGTVTDEDVAKPDTTGYISID